MIVNSQPISREVRALYRKEQSYPVKVDTAKLKLFAKRIIASGLVEETGGVVRHSQKIASVIAHI